MKITFIIGGTRSGKSSFALTEASKIKGQKAYIATAEASDGEMKERIERHKKDRGQKWDTYEEPLNISGVLLKVKDKYRVVIIDCLTLWLSNLLLIRAENPPLPPFSKGGRGGFKYRTQIVKKEIHRFIDELKTFKTSSIVNRQSSIFIVSNEVGMGIVPENGLARRFRDFAGILNQKVAEIADEVYMVTAGVPIKIKSSK